jgi:predicted RNA binding protein YcfA (HicA-like mRNA interferase family)
MPEVPVLSGQEVVRAFEKMGWKIMRQRGSHIVMTKIEALKD